MGQQCSALTKSMNHCLKEEDHAVAYQRCVVLGRCRIAIRSREKVDNRGQTREKKEMALREDETGSIFVCAQLKKYCSPWFL